MMMLERIDKEQVVKDQPVITNIIIPTHNVRSRDNLCDIEMKKPITLSNKYQLLETDDDSNRTKQ